jgi:hypothetical protein
MWIDYSSNEIDAPLSSWILPLWGVWPYDKKARGFATTTAGDGCGARKRVAPRAARRAATHRAPRAPRPADAPPRVPAAPRRRRRLPRRR